MRLNASPHFFTMSDGARVAIFYMASLGISYRILPPGSLTWTSPVQLQGNAVSSGGAVFTQVGNTIYGALAADLGGGKVTLSRLAYSGGSIGQSSAFVAHGDQFMYSYAKGIYWDATNSYLHVVYTLSTNNQTATAVWLEAYNASLANVFGLDVLSYTFGKASGATTQLVSLAGGGSNAFVLSDWGGAGGVGKVTAVTAAASSYSVVADSAVPSLPVPGGAGWDIATTWDGANVVFAAAVSVDSGSSVQVLSRSGGGTYDGWQVVAMPPTGTQIYAGLGVWAPALVRRLGMPTDDLSLLFHVLANPGGSTQMIQVWSTQRRSGAWGGTVLMTAGSAAYVSGAPSDINDSGNVPFLLTCSGCGTIATSVPFGDLASSLPSAFGKPLLSPHSKDPVNAATGTFSTSATDLTMPGRALPFAFTRTYNSAETRLSPLGPGWTHSYHWTILDSATSVEVRRGDGRRDEFTQNPDATYSAPQNVFDTLVKNADSTFTLTLTNQIKYQFSTSGSLTAIQEPAGNQLTLAYTSGKLTTITDTVGRAVTLIYDTLNRLHQVTDPLGRKVIYDYDTNNRLTTMTDKIGNAPGQNPLLHRWQYGYDGSTPHITTITDPDGRVRVTNTYDAQGRVYQQRDGKNKLTTFDYSTPGQTVVTDPRLHATTFTFDARARVLTQTDVVGANTYVLSYVYNPTTGNRESVTDRNGKTTDFTYDARGNLKTRTDPQVDPLIPRYVTSYDYDLKNNLTLITDPRGFTTTNAYDPTTSVLLSVTRQIDATTSAVTKYEYTDAANPGLPTKIIAPRGNLTGNPDYTYATTLTYDTQGNLLTRTDPDGAKTTYAYDAVGRMTSFVDPDGNAAGASSVGHSWTIGYDENDQEKSRTDPLGKSLLYGYDGAGNRTSATDRNVNITTYTYDENARLATVSQKPDPGTTYLTTIGRDDNGNATSTTQANNVITNYGFDALDRMTSMTTHPAVGTDLVTSYVLDGNGNVLTKTTADATVVTNTYDAVNRLKSVAATGLTTITYDYDASGNRTQMVDETGTTTYQYDGLGRVTQVAQPSGTLGYAYDRDGNRTTLTYPGTTGSVTYVFTPGGRLDHLTDWASRTSTYTYTASGLPDTLLYPNGMKAVYTYDRAQRLLAVADAVASTTVNREVYALDGEGNRTVNDEYVQGISVAPSLTWSASVKVNSDTGSAAQDHPAIALGADGAGYLIWDDTRNGNLNIYFSKRDPSTGAWGTDVRVNDDTGTRIQQNPAINVDSAGNAYAVWQDERNGAGKPDTFYAKRAAGGSTWSANLRVNDDGNPQTVQRNPRIAGTAAGAQTAVWVDLRNSQNNIYSSTLAAGGSTWAANKPVTSGNTTALKDFPDVVVGTDGTSYAVWQDNRNGATNPDIYFASLAPGAANWSANVKVSDDPGTAAQRQPRIGIDAAGNLTVVWLDDRATPTTIRMSRQLAGTATWTPSVVVTDAPARPVSVALAVRPDGIAQVAFGDTRGSSADIYRSEYDPWLRVWSPSTLVSDDPGSAAQSSPTVAYTATELSAAWRDDRAGNADARARRALLAGGADHLAYTYDGLNRLKTTTGPVAESFVLDAASNISTRTGPTASYTYDNSNRLTSDGAQTFTWNNADRLAGRGADTFSYDPLGRLKSTTAGGTTRAFAYSGEGVLASATQGSTTSYVWDTASAPESLVGIGADRVVHGLGPLYGVRSDGTTYTLARDGLGSVRAEMSDAGALTKSFRFRVYGTLASSFGGSPTLLSYAGEMADANGLLYLRARWYDPVAAIFLRRDPYAGVAEKPSTLNGFGYADRNPTMLIDPSGLDPSFARALFYGLADILRDLDSTDPATRRGAFLKVCAIGIGTGAVVATGIYLGSAMLASSETAGTTQIFRAVGQEEAADIGATGVFRGLWWHTGKYFFLEESSAVDFAATSAQPGMSIASGTIERSLLTRLLASDPVHAAGEGPGLFIRNEFLHLIKNVTLQ